MLDRAGGRLVEGGSSAGPTPRSCSLSRSTNMETCLMHLVCSRTAASWTVRTPAWQRYGSGAALRASLGNTFIFLEKCDSEMFIWLQQDGRILDRGSPRLAEVRQQRKANGVELRASLAEWARKLHASGVSERAQVRFRVYLHMITRASSEFGCVSQCIACSCGTCSTDVSAVSRHMKTCMMRSLPLMSQVVVRRDRQCVAVRAGRQGELPRGSVTLASSSTWASYLPSH